MTLDKLYGVFDSRCKSYSSRIQHIISTRATIEEWKFNYQTEVLISDMWQSWCLFCRSLFFESCRGTKARNNASIAPRPYDNSWKRLGYEAKQYSSGSGCRPTGHINFLIRKEPTWGDLNVFLKILTNIQIKPANQPHLITTFGSFTDLKHLQRVRNACAHKNVETMQDIKQLTSSYSFSRLSCAPQLAWSTKSPGQEYAIEHWLFEMNLIADLATSTS
tara:strand:- start:898 stop:1554 length:657 start_codon:yes stop_codon:yes gene_type:complete